MRLSINFLCKEGAEITEILMFFEVLKLCKRPAEILKCLFREKFVERSAKLSPEIR